MAMKILESCISCGNCEPECPNQAIHAGEALYTIDGERCTECVGAFDEPRCVAVCPVEETIAVDPAFLESRDALRAKFDRLHA